MPATGGYFGKYVNVWDGVGGIDAPEGYVDRRQLVDAATGTNSTST